MAYAQTHSRQSICRDQAPPCLPRVAELPLVPGEPGGAHHRFQTRTSGNKEICAIPESVKSGFRPRGVSQTCGRMRDVHNALLLFCHLAPHKPEDATRPMVFRRAAHRRLRYFPQVVVVICQFLKVTPPAFRSGRGLCFNQLPLAKNQRYGTGKHSNPDWPCSGQLFLRWVLLLPWLHKVSAVKAACCTAGLL